MTGEGFIPFAVVKAAAIYAVNADDTAVEFLTSDGPWMIALNHVWQTARTQTGEEIAAAIEHNEGRRCPECGLMRATIKWSTDHHTVIGRCVNNHTWDYVPTDIRLPGDIARELVGLPNPDEAAPRTRRGRQYELDGPHTADPEATT